MRFFAFIAATTIISAAPLSINLSQDLVRLGIAPHNAVPNHSELDVRPLLQNALAYAKLHSIHTVTADPGNYYFLTTSAPGQYLVLDHVSDLTLDFHGSSLYFQDSYSSAITLNDCERTTLQNFSVDFLHLPFTQVAITSVSPSAREIAIENAAETDQLLHQDAELWALAFRNGALVPGTNRLPIEHNSPKPLRIADDHAPWTEPSAIAKMKPGDTLVLASRAGPAAIRSNFGRAITLNHVDIYSSGSLGLQLDHAVDSVVSHVRVIPRPGTHRLLSANADGIHLSYVGANNHIVDCLVSHTMDDGIAINSPVLGMVEQRLTARSLRIKRNYASLIPAQTRIALVDPRTGFASLRFTVISEKAESESITLTLDRNVPPAPEHFGVILSDPKQRGAGTIIERNTVEGVLSARGIFLGGVSGVTIQNNIVRRTSAGGIVLHEDLAAFPTGPSEDIQITGNTVDQAIGLMETGAGAVASIASILVLATDSSFQLLPAAPLKRITIANNTITHSGRAGIWVGNTSGAVVNGNTITDWNQHPELAFWGIGDRWATQLRKDAARPSTIR